MMALVTAQKLSILRTLPMDRHLEGPKLQATSIRGGFRLLFSNTQRFKRGQV